MKRKDKAAQAVETMGFDDEPLEQDEQLEAEPQETGEPAAAALEAGPQPPRRGRQGDEGRPFCRRHLCLLRAAGSTENVTRYACPVPGCCEKAKVSRPAALYPAEPKPCPQRTCADPPRYLEAVDHSRAGGQVRLQCPSCGFAVLTPNPQLAREAVLAARSRAAEEL